MLTLFSIQDSPVIDMNAFDNMWKKGTHAVASVAPVVCTPSVSVNVTYDKKTVPKTGPEKYCKALSFCKQMCTIISDCGTAQFSQRFHVIKELVRIWAKGEEAIVLQDLGNNRALSKEGKGKYKTV